MLYNNAQDRAVNFLFNLEQVANWGDILQNVVDLIKVRVVPFPARSVSPARPDGFSTRGPRRVKS